MELHMQCMPSVGTKFRYNTSFMRLLMAFVSLTLGNIAMEDVKGKTNKTITTTIANSNRIKKTDKKEADRYRRSEKKDVELICDWAVQS